MRTVGRAAPGTDTARPLGATTPSERTQNFNIHGLLKIRTNVPLVPGIPEHFRSRSMDPDLEVLRVADLPAPADEAVKGMVGYPRTCDLGDGEAYFECPAPFLHYLGAASKWKFLLRGMAEDETRILTAFPGFAGWPIIARLQDLLSRLVYLVIIMKLAGRGVALCHASAAAHGDRAYVLFGYGGTGKTTLTKALMDSVCDGFLSDDYVLARGTGELLCWPDYYPPHSDEQGTPGLRYLFGRYRQTARAPFPIRKDAEVDSILFLEHGKSEIVELTAEEASRRAMLLNMEEIWRLWNSPASQLLGQYAYFNPRLDIRGFLERYAAIVSSFVDRASLRLVVRSPSPTFEMARGLVSDLTRRMTR